MPSSTSQAWRWILGCALLLLLSGSLARPERPAPVLEIARQESPAQQIGGTEIPFNGALPSGTERVRLPSQAAPQFVWHLDGPRARDAGVGATGRTGIARPALSRWLLAHATSTSIP